MPLFTEKTVPVTLTVQSPEATRRWPLRRFAAWTMMRPRVRWMVVSRPRAVTDSSARSLISTSEPSPRRSTAREAPAVRTSSASPISAPGESRTAVSAAMRWRPPLTDCTAARLPAGTRKKAWWTAHADPRAASRTVAAIAYCLRRRGAAVADPLDARQGRSARCRSPGRRNAPRHATQSRRWSSIRSARAAGSSPRRCAGRRATTSAHPAIASEEGVKPSRAGASRSHTRAAASPATSEAGTSSRSEAIASSRLDSLRLVSSLIAGLSSIARAPPAGAAGCGAG